MGGTRRNAVGGVAAGSDVGSGAVCGVVLGPVAVTEAAAWVASFG